MVAFFFVYLLIIWWTFCFRNDYNRMVYAVSDSKDVVYRSQFVVCYFHHSYLIISQSPSIYMSSLFFLLFVLFSWMCIKFDIIEATFRTCVWSQRDIPYNVNQHLFFGLHYTYTFIHLWCKMGNNLPAFELNWFTDFDIEMQWKWLWCRFSTKMID